MQALSIAFTIAGSSGCLNIPAKPWLGVKVWRKPTFPQIDPYIAISMPIAVADEKYIVPVLVFNGKEYGLVKGSGMNINEVIEVLRKADVPGILASLEEVTQSFVTHYAKALIVARMSTL